MENLGIMGKICNIFFLNVCPENFCVICPENFFVYVQKNVFHPLFCICPEKFFGLYPKKKWRRGGGEF